MMQKSEIGVLLRDVRSSCNLHFEVFELIFCHRGCNKLSHEFDQYGVRAGLPISEWIEHSPEFGYSPVASDLAEQVV
jgi:hypothetical protein